MGLEIELFVYPERISPELICSICQCVVEKPVQTPSEHLFCEDELLEWMIRSDLCPVTHEPLDPGTIKKPGRIITNMLGALERYCENREEGCPWQGQCERYSTHQSDCEYKSRNNLSKQLEEKNKVISDLKGKLTLAQNRISELERENESLIESNELMKRKLKVYDAFFERDGMSLSREPVNEAKTISDVGKLSRLRGLETLNLSSESEGNGKQKQLVSL